MDRTFTPTHINTATTTVVKSGSGTLGHISVNTLVASETITIYDGTSDAGTLLAVITLPSTITGVTPFETLRNIAFGTGLTIVTSSIADITVGWQ